MRKSRPKRFELEEIKRRLLDYLEKIGSDPQEKSGGKFIALCPLHDDHNPSLSVKEKDGVPVWYCHPCATGGTLIDLHMKLEGVDLREAIKQLGERYGAGALFTTTNTAKRVASPKIERVIKAPAELTSVELRAVKKARNLLYDRDDLQKRFADELGLKPETIRNATMPAEAALGYSERFDRLLYIYPAGVKIRHSTRQEPHSEPRFEWKAGRATEPWGAVHLRFRKNLQAVYLVEGETDRLALIEAGVQNLCGSPGSVVVASPGTSFKKEWAPMFRSMDVVICFDPGEAGQKAARRVGGILAPVASKVEIVDLRSGGAAL